VIETGTFDELVAQGGRFAELAKAQFMVQENVQDNVRENARASVPALDTDSAAVKI
jgi:ATP-binding cassette, subfamily B, beta-glucan exporter